MHQKVISQINRDTDFTSQNIAEAKAQFPYVGKYKIGLSSQAYGKRANESTRNSSGPQSLHKTFSAKKNSLMINRKFSKGFISSNISSIEENKESNPSQFFSEEKEMECSDREVIQVF